MNPAYSMKVPTKDVACPLCNARSGRACKSSRLPSANSYGGGWGGYADLRRSHSERVEAAKALGGGAL